VTDETDGDDDETDGDDHELETDGDEMDDGVLTNDEAETDETV
jgi:hypothetical protein